MSTPSPHPIRLTVTDDLRRSRLTVAFRLLLFIPHYIWLYLWGWVALIVFVLTWLCALVLGRPPRPFHRFLGAYVRYQTHVIAFVTLVGNPFPGFVGKRGSYPIDLETPVEPQHQNRLATLFRILLVIPAAFVAYPLLYALLIAAFFAWWVSLVRGRTTEGYRDLGAFVLRYQGQVYGYLFLQTARYPNPSPRAEFETPLPAAQIAEPPPADTPVPATS